MKSFIIGVSLSLAAIFSSCKKEVSAPSVTTSALQDLVLSDTSVSIFNAAINLTSETGLLQRTDYVTLIIPTNDAFRAAGIDNSNISSVGTGKLDSIINYLFIPSVVTPTTSSITAYSSQLGAPVFGSNDGTNIYFNGTTGVLQMTPTGSNTTLYKINTLLMPPSLTIVQALQADPNTSLFAEAFQRTNAGATLTGSSTILVPTNAAFALAGYPDITSIDNADMTMLTNLVNYHILTSQYFTNNFAGIGTTSTDEGAAITVINSSGGPKFTGNNNPVPANIVKANWLLKGNIVVDQIDAVLQP